MLLILTGVLNHVTYRSTRPLEAQIICLTLQQSRADI